MNEPNLSGKTRLLPYDTIVAATKGDVDAINTVLKHFESYIIVLSTRRLSDEYGNTVLYVDDDLRRRLETKLITKVLTFSI